MKKFKYLSETELKYMKIIWDHPAGVSSEEIYSHFSQALGTKSTILHRITTKGYVYVQKKGRQYIYTPKITFAEYESTILDDTVGRLEKTISSFFNYRLNEKQCDKIKALLKELEEMEGGHDLP